MASAAVVVGNLGTDQWDADVYTVLSMASRLAALVKSRAQTFQLAYNLVILNRSLGKFFQEVRDRLDGKIIEANSEIPTPAQLDEMAADAGLLLSRH